MMLELETLNDEICCISHLSALDKDDISKFVIKRRQGRGLEVYLKEVALQQEAIGESRTYIIRERECNQIVAYFTLRTGLITVSRGFLRGFNTHTGIEFANFAVNDAYREDNDRIPMLGSYIFYSFVIPLVQYISDFVGAELLYIYALPHDRLMEHYRTMGFETASKKVSRYLYRHVKPFYDRQCVFMYQAIR